MIAKHWNAAALRRIGPLITVGLAVLATRHAPFAQAQPWDLLDAVLVSGTLAAAATLMRRPPQSARLRVLWFGAAVGAVNVLVAATGGATSPFLLLLDLIAVVAATTLTGTSFGIVVGLVTIACLLPFLYARPLPREFLVMTTIGAPVLLVISAFTRALFAREQAMTRLAEERALMLEESFDATLLALGTALDLRDTETEGHARRVARNSRAIGERLGLGRDQLICVERGAYLHDIGKIGVPDAVLRKPGALDDAEWREMRRHAGLGADILRRVPFLRPAAALVAAHHERWDGTGYPARLAGEAIPLGARIFAVADAYDAMTSDRPYRRAMPHPVAVNEIARASGTQFDLRVVAIFVTLAEEGLLLRGASGEDGTAAGALGARPAAAPRRPLVA